MARPPHRSAGYLRAKAALAASFVLCWECQERRATVPDHHPALSEHTHVEGSGCCQLRPHCLACSRAEGGRRAAAARADTVEAFDLFDPVGFPVEHPVWDVPWLQPFLAVPDNAAWPRLMTPPHPHAVGSLGPVFAKAAAERMGTPLRWWQELAATRLLEHDSDGRLVWRVMLLSTSRQVGKSVLLRELLAWRLTQGHRFGGEPQTLLHIAKDVAVTRWVQRGARSWARQYPDRFRVREANGAESIEYLEDGSVWLLKSRTGVFGFSASMAVVDEAWKISSEHVEDGLMPTLVERASPQLVLSSTAHPQATSLFVNHRQQALAALDDPGQADLIVEWSAPHDADLEDVAAWRQASPHWTPEREAAIRSAVELALTSSADPNQPDPRAGFMGQWLSRWPSEAAAGRQGQPLLPAGVWERNRSGAHGVGPATIAVEDWFGEGAAVAAARRVQDGRLILAAWEFETRQQAAECAAWMAEVSGSRMVVGASLISDPWIREVPVTGTVAATGATTRAGLPLFRELAAAGQLVWDEADGAALSSHLESARVVQLASGPRLLSSGRQDLLRAAIWAVAAACEKPAPVPAIY